MISEDLMRAKEVSCEEIVTWSKFRNLVLTEKLLDFTKVFPFFSKEGIEMIREDLLEYNKFRHWWKERGSWKQMGEFRKRLEYINKQTDNYLTAMEEKKYARPNEFDVALAIGAPALKKYTLVDFVIGKALELGAKFGTPNGFVYRLIFKEPGSDVERILDTTSSLFVHDWKAAKVQRDQEFFMMRVPVTDPDPADPKFATVYRWIFHAIRERQAEIKPAEEGPAI